MTESSEKSEEEMVMQDWRADRFLRESYLDSIRVMIYAYICTMGLITCFRMSMMT